MQRERCEDEAERQHGAEVVDEAGGKHGLAVFGPVQPVFDHHRVNHGDRCGGECDAGEPARHDLPAEDVVGRRRAAEKRKDEADEAQRGRLLPFLFENQRIEFRPGKKGQHDGADTGEEFDPWLIDAEGGGADGAADDQLRHRSDDDLCECGRNTKPYRKQARNQCKAHPQC